MELTIQYLTEKFREYNKLYFDTHLPTPNFKLMKSYRTAGLFSCDKIIGKRRLKHQCIEISCYYDWTEEKLRDILVHEMVHYYLAYKHIDNELSHGEEFIKMCEDMNKKYGLNLSVIIDMTNVKRNKKAPRLSWFLVHIFG